MWRIKVSKRPYVSPRLNKFAGIQDVPPHLRDAAEDLLLETGVVSNVLDRERRFLSVSEGFARMLGYRTMELIGRRVDEVTAPGSIDIDFVFRTFAQVREMDGIWIFLHRDGHRVVVHYHARLSDEYTYAELQPLLVA